LTIPHHMMGRSMQPHLLTGHADKHFELVKRVLSRWTGLTHWHHCLSERRRIDVRNICVAFAKHHGVVAYWREWIDSKPTDLFVPLTEADRWIRSRGVTSTNARLAWWLYTWARKDVHLRQWAADEHAGFENSRDAFFREAAIRLSTQFETISVDDYDIAVLKKQPELKKQEDVYVPPQVRYNLQHAAPGRFREILIEVMGPRCKPSERPGGLEKPVTSRESTKAGDSSETPSNDVTMDTADAAE
ncbi:MAG: hypothetical protein DRH30_04805, partial [Deltaproteobacteria bacterium]